MAQAQLTPQQALKQKLVRTANEDQKTALNYLVPAAGCGAKKVADADYDAVLKKLLDSANTYQKAIDKIGLDESELQEIPPVTLVGYETDGTILGRTGEDGTYRTDVYSVTHLFFSSTQVYVYQIILNTTKGDKKERTEEYFYKDITNFSTSNDSKEVQYFVAGKGCAGAGSYQTGSIETQRFALIVPGDRFSVATYGDIEASVKAMKNKLREKKQ